MPEATMGRPSDYTVELAAQICGELAAGRSLRSVCKDEWAPNRSTVFRWLAQFPEFRDQYARAKEESSDALVEELLDIADDGSNDWMERAGSDGSHLGWQVNGEHIQRSRVRIDTRKWIASKLKPKKYGERIEHVGSVSVAGSMTDAEIDARIEELRARRARTAPGAEGADRGEKKPSSIH